VQPPVCGTQKLLRLVAPATFDRGTNCALAVSRTASARARYPQRNQSPQLCHCEPKAWQSASPCSDVVAIRIPLFSTIASADCL
ncbi:MAG: hypothetical protein IKT68_07450, partial [Clostridia bacterium]|nr:hypothetical protein [Clostridia bacterium]